MGRRAVLNKTYSDDSGSFVLRGIPEGQDVSVEVAKSGFVTRRIEIKSGELLRRSKVRIELSKGHSLAGLLRDEAAQPVAGAKVVLLRGSDRPRATSYSDGEGRFVFANLGEGLYTVVARNVGSVPGRKRVNVPKGEGRIDVGTLVLKEGASLVGEVLDGEGVPIEGAEIFVDRRPGARSMGLDGRSRMEAAAVSDADGRFVVHELGAGERVQLEVWREGFLPGVVGGVEAPNHEPLQIILRPAARLSGRVVDEAGKGIADVGVAVFRSDIEESAASGRWLIFTDGEGYFRFDDLRPGRVKLSVRAPRYQPADLPDVALSGGGTDEPLEIVLQRGAVIEGKVLSADGEPVIGATVRVLGEGASAPGVDFLSGWAETDGDGFFRLDSVTPGKRAIEVSHLDHPRAVLSIEVENGSQWLDVRLKDARHSTISGVLIDGGEAGASLGGVRVALTPVNGGRMYASESGPDGSFLIDKVVDGLYRVVVSRGELRVKHPRDPIRVTGPVEHLQVVLDSGARVAGRILGLPPEDFLDLRVVAYSAWRTSRGDVDAASGQYAVDGLTPGVWRITATDAHGRVAEGSLTLEDGSEEERLDLTFEPGVMLTGVVLDNGQPLAYARVALRGEGRRQDRGESCDEDGRFQFDSVSPGRYVLVIHRAGGAMRPRGMAVHVQEIELLADEELVIDVSTVALTGEVRDPEGKPISGARVAFEHVSQPATEVGPRYLTGADGRFALDSVPSGTWRLRAEKAGFGSIRRVVEARPGEEVFVELTLEPTTGLVLDLQGSPATLPPRVAVRVCAVDDSAALAIEGWHPTGEGGRVHLPIVPPGRWQVFVRGLTGGLVGLVPEAVVPGPPVAVQLLDVGWLEIAIPSLQGTASAAGLRIDDAMGRPACAAPPQAIRGGHAMVELPPGRWHVRVETERGESWEGTSAVAPGARSRLVLE